MQLADGTVGTPSTSFTIGSGSTKTVLSSASQTASRALAFPDVSGTLGVGSSSQALTEASTISVDWFPNRVGTVTLTGNRILSVSVLSNAVVGETMYLLISQDATGDRSLVWSASSMSFKFAHGVAPKLCAAPSGQTLLQLFLVTAGASPEFLVVPLGQNFQADSGQLATEGPANLALLALKGIK